MTRRSQAARWTDLQEVRARVRKLWDRGQLLSERVPSGPGGTAVHDPDPEPEPDDRSTDAAAPLFPLRIPLRGPRAGEIADDFGAVLDWSRAWLTASEADPTFDLELQTANNRVQGSNELPAAVVFATAENALRFLGRLKDAERFDALCAQTLAAEPGLRPWLHRRPLALLDHAARWPEVLATLRWFRHHPRPGTYLRQLEIPGVDTKFVEGHKKLLSELLDLVLPAHAIDPEAPTGARSFERRYGLRTPTPLVRFRILDPDLSPDLAGRGVSDLSLPADQFAALDLAPNRVFVTENVTNGLAFPEHPRSLVVFGLGYGLDRLVRTPWLGGAEVHYWGDIDTHGFGILDRVRQALPTARSFLMDREILLAHRPLWVQEPAAHRFGGEAPHLTRDERELFDDLREDRLGPRVRLEQERVGFAHVRAALDGLR